MLAKNVFVMTMVLILAEISKQEYVEELCINKIEVDVDKVHESLQALIAAVKQNNAYFHKFETNMKTQADEIKNSFDQIKKWSSFPCSALRSLKLERFKNGNYFYFKDGKMSHPDAVNWCKARGMRLARIKNASDMADLTLKSPSQEDAFYWVDGNKTGSAQYIWSDGTQIDPQLWSAPKEPNIVDSDACVVLHIGVGTCKKLYDEVCSRTYYHICEVDAAQIDCL